MHPMERSFRQAMLDLITSAIDLENEHHLKAIETLMDNSEQSLDSLVLSRNDSLDAYFENLRDMEDTARPRPQKMLEEISGLVGVQLRLNNEQLRMMGEDPEQVKEDIQNLIAGNLTALYASRVISAVQNRFGETIGERFEISNWDDATDKILGAAEDALDNRRERLVGENGQIARDIDALMPHALNDTAKLN